jgi:transposase
MRIAWRNYLYMGSETFAEPPVAVLNLLRSRRLAEEELQRTKTDAIDALGIARFAAQKRPAAQLPDAAPEELRELARLRERPQENFASRFRQLHRAVDQGFRNLLGMCAPSRASSPPPTRSRSRLRSRHQTLRRLSKFVPAVTLCISKRRAFPRNSLAQVHRGGADKAIQSHTIARIHPPITSVGQ